MSFSLVYIMYKLLRVTTLKHEDTKKYCEEGKGIVFEPLRHNDANASHKGRRKNIITNFVVNALCAFVVQ